MSVLSFSFFFLGVKNDGLLWVEGQNGEEKDVFHTLAGLLPLPRTPGSSLREVVVIDGFQK